MLSLCPFPSTAKLLLIFQNSFKTHQKILLVVSHHLTATTPFQTVMSPILGSHVSIYHIAARVTFSSHKAEYVTLLLQNFQWLFSVVSWLARVHKLGPLLLLHYSSTFPLFSFFAGHKPLHLSFPLTSQNAVPSSLQGWLFLSLMSPLQCPRVFEVWPPDHTCSILYFSHHPVYFLQSIQSVIILFSYLFIFSLD